MTRMCLTLLVLTRRGAMTRDDTLHRPRTVCVNSRGMDRAVCVNSRGMDRDLAATEAPRVQHHARVLTRGRRIGKYGIEYRYSL